MYIGRGFLLLLPTCMLDVCLFAGFCDSPYTSVSVEHIVNVIPLQF